MIYGVIHYMNKIIVPKKITKENFEDAKRADWLIIYKDLTDEQRSFDSNIYQEAVKKWREKWNKIYKTL